MSNDNFFKDSITLTTSNLVTGILGFMFSIILSRELGAEGMGLYGLVMPIYNLFICLISGGMVAAISKVAAVYFGKKDYKNLNKSIKTCLTFDLIWGSIVVFFVFFGSSFISNNIIKDPRALNSLKFICPAMIFVSLSSILKGYFYGISKVHIPAFIDIFEKAIRIAVILLVIKFFSLTNVNSTVTAAYTALTIGELTSLILLYIFYKASRRKPSLQRSKPEGRSQLLFNVLIISFPLCLNGFLTTILTTISTLIVPRRLISAGFEYSAALSMIGKFSGMALNITFFPMLVIGAMITVLIPNLSQSISKKDFFSLENRITQVLEISFLLGISTLAICFTIPDSLGKLFYNRNDLGPYIKFAALSAPLIFPCITTYGILNGIGKQGILLKNSIIVSIIEVFLLFLLTGIPVINIYGLGITLIITSIIGLTLNLHEIKKKCYLNFSLTNAFTDILLGVLTFFVLNIINNLLPNSIFVFKNLIILILGFSFVFFTHSALKSKKGLDF